MSDEFDCDDCPLAEECGCKKEIDRLKAENEQMGKREARHVLQSKKWESRIAELEAELKRKDEQLQSVLHLCPCLEEGNCDKVWNLITGHNYEYDYFEKDAPKPKEAGK